jgi:hypothetical protein
MASVFDPRSIVFDGVLGALTGGLLKSPDILLITPDVGGSF